MRPAIARLIALPVVASTLVLAAVTSAIACTPDEIAAIVERTGARLRQASGETQPRLQAKMRQLGERERWSAGEIEDKAYAFVTDDETRRLDEDAGNLLVRFDRLGQEGPTCERKAELEQVSAQLLEVTLAKAAHITARLDAALRSPPPPTTTTRAPASAPPAPAQPAASAQVKRADAARVEPQPKFPRPSAPAAPAPQWQTETKSTPGAIAELPPRVAELADAEFSEEDIRAAGSGFFGSISAGLASVFEYAFKSYGRPTGYVLGSEGGGAFLAGLRYGDGTLVTKRGGERKVFWQGPSVGYDFGLAGSRVMFLVYNLKDGEELFARYGGVDGSAYFVGGVGITFLKKGRIVLAPIRSGVGLRLGANIGYLKFTPTASLNPF